MIHVFFVPGMFGTTIEYLIRNYTKEYIKNNTGILPDGSMHSFLKECHPANLTELNYSKIKKSSIITITYPFTHIHLADILKDYPFDLNDNCILVHADNFESAELNCLFQYHKIAVGTQSRAGLKIFCGNNEHNITAWNKSYTSWQDMQRWELREWFSIFYPSWIQEWISSPALVPDTWKIFSNTEFLTTPEEVFRQIINFCNLTEDSGLIDFTNKWRAAQQYIIDEFILLDQIVKNTLTQQEFSWYPINIIAESIIQQRLRSNGYEIMCDGLNEFPTSSCHLYKMLIKI
jgi:hypothetical protein